MVWVRFTAARETRGNTTFKPELFDLVNVKNVFEVKEMIHKATEECRTRNGYTVRELMGNEIEDEDNEHGDLL